MNNNINEDQFQKLSKFHSSSWALWSDKFNKKGCLESNPKDIYNFLSTKLKFLKNDIVLLGLNHSSFKINKSSNLNSQNSIPFAPFETFHTASHSGDGRLKRYIQEGDLKNFKGSYMTNLSEEIDSNSHNVNILPRDFDYLYEQLNILKAKIISIICLGGEVFTNMKKNFNITKPRIIKITSTEFSINNFSTRFRDLKLNVFQVYHHSSRGCCNQILREQLKFINNFELNQNNL